MRGRVDRQGEIFHTFNLQELVPDQHPLRCIKTRADRILAKMSRRFAQAYSPTGRPSIPPERLIKGLLLRALYSIRSEIQLCEQIGYNLLYRWFLDMCPSETVWTPEVFSMNRKRFQQHGFVGDFFDRVVHEALLDDLVSEDHFSVDGSLIQSYASIKSLRSIDSADRKVSDGTEDGDPGNPTVDFRGQKRSNKTHRSLVDPEARLLRKSSGQPAVLSHSLHVLMENRNGLCLDVAVEEANGRCERQAAVQMLDETYEHHGLWPKTLGADGGYAEAAFLKTMELTGIRPHIPIPKRVIRGDGPSAEVRRRTRRRQSTVGYQLSQRARKRIEEIIGWCKTIGGLARTRFVDRWRTGLSAEVTAAAYNLLRMARLRPAA